MWITTITYDSAGLLTISPEDFEQIRVSIEDKKNTLKSIDGAGNSIPGFEKPQIGTIDPSSPVVIKRGWNTESAAREFANFADAASEFIVVSVEEQV